MKKKSKETITINKKVIAGIMCLVPLIAILISKHRVGEMVLLFLGVGVGVFIGLNWKVKK